MAILSVTYLNGTPRSGVSQMASWFNAKNEYYAVGDTYFSHIKTKEDLFKLLNTWKAEESKRNVVLVGDKIYQAIDYHFDDIPQYYVSLDHKRPFIPPVEAEEKPLLGS